jgi:hypothetical protein
MLLNKDLSAQFCDTRIFLKHLNFLLMIYIPFLSSSSVIILLLADFPERLPTYHDNEFNMQHNYNQSTEVAHMQCTQSDPTFICVTC